jgi:hypothetical protein
MIIYFSSTSKRTTGIQKVRRSVARDVAPNDHTIDVVDVDWAQIEQRHVLEVDDSKDCSQIGYRIIYNKRERSE